MKRDYAHCLAVEANLYGGFSLPVAGEDFTSKLCSELKCPQNPQIRDSDITKTKTKINRYVELTVKLSWRGYLNRSVGMQVCIVQHVFSSVHGELCCFEIVFLFCGKDNSGIDGV